MLLLRVSVLAQLLARDVAAEEQLAAEPSNERVATVVSASYCGRRLGVM